MESVRRLVLTFCCVLAVVLFAARGAQAGTPLRVGIYPDAPLVFLDAKEVPQGVYVDLLQHIAPQEGWQIQYVSGSWEQGLARLRLGRIDLMTAIAYSEERARDFDFTRESVIVNWGQVYVPPKSPIASMLDLTDRKLAVVPEDIYYETFKRISSLSNIHPHFVEVASYRDTLRLVAAGEADGALLPRLYAAYHAEEFGVEKTAIIFSPSELRFAAPKGTRRPILDALDRHLARLKADKRSVYYRSLNVWIEGVHTLIFPKWLKPTWVLSGVGALILWIGAMNLVLRWRVRVKTNALRDTLAAQERIEGELRVAHNIQMGSVRRDFPAIPGYEMYGVLQPARAVGGDFYDWFFADPDHLCFVLGDVSGKGVPAALLMAATKSLLNVTGRGNPHPGGMLEVTNRQVLTGNEACMFVTVFCGVLDVRTGVICYSSAGHNPPVVVRDGGRLEYLEEARSPPIGIDEGVVYEEAAVTLRPGDALFMYTDGVTEARSLGRAMFSEEGLQDALSRAAGGSATDLVLGTLEAVKRFGKDAPQADDIAVMAVRHARDGDLGVRVWFTLRSEMSEISGLSQRVLRLGKDRGLPDEAVADVRLALEEVVSNIIRHAYAGKGDREIQVLLGLQGDEITVEVQDEGAPFNPLEHPEPDAGVPAEDRRSGGYGILLLKGAMDEVAYRLERGRNLLVMKKRISRPSGGGGTT